MAAHATLCGREVERAGTAVQKFIVILAAITLFVLYRAMQHEINRPNPGQRANDQLILATLQDLKMPCDRVKGFRFLTSHGGVDYYYAQCGDGGRYLFMQNIPRAAVIAKTCTFMALHGYRCPDE